MPSFTISNFMSTTAGIQSKAEEKPSFAGMRLDWLMHPSNKEKDRQNKTKGEGHTQRSLGLGATDELPRNAGHSLPSLPPRESPEHRQLPSQHSPNQEDAIRGHRSPEAVGMGWRGGGAGRRAPPLAQHGHPRGSPSPLLSLTQTVLLTSKSLAKLLT